MGTHLLSVDAPLSKRVAMSPPLKKQLGKIQGNILKPHGRDHSVHLLLNIPDTVSTTEIKAWLSHFGMTHVTTAAAQLEQATRHTQDITSASTEGTPEELFASLFISADGYRRLGLSLDQFRDTSFVDGMKASGPQRIGDPAVASWEGQYQRSVHAMLLMASDHHDALTTAADLIAAELADLGITVARENGIVKRNAEDRLQDPFGFAHGISQPIFFKEDITVEKRPPDRSPGRYGNWDPSALPGLVLVRDPLFTDDDDALGSYLVFRKLEMDTDGFATRMAKTAKALGLNGQPDAANYAAALVAGRYSNGTPLVSANPLTAAKALGSNNDFSYVEDKNGAVCPIQSHTRKANPRGTSRNGLADEREHRIARRGVNYEEAPSATDGAPARQGMLFMCYQAKIQRQFEFIQKRWLNDDDFPEPACGRDPIAGIGEPWRAQKWPVPGEANDLFKFAIGGFVTLKGGDYFFAPSIPFLERLGQAAA